MTGTRSYRTAIAIALVLGAAGPAAAQAQAAADILRRAVAGQAERLAGVENVTITSELMGMQIVTYMVKRVVGSAPTLVPTAVTVAGMTTQAPAGDAAIDWSTPFQEAFAERARLAGQDDIDGRAVHVIEIDDFAGLDMPVPPALPTGATYHVRSARFYLDADRLLMLRMVMRAEIVHPDGTTAPVGTLVEMYDYRDVQGYLHPFRTHTRVEGIAEASGLDREELHAMVEQLRRQLEGVPAERRAAVESMLRPQLGQLEGMLSGDGALEITTTVSEVRVNAGRPDGRPGPRSRSR